MVVWYVSSNFIKETPIDTEVLRLSQLPVLSKIGKGPDINIHLIWWSFTQQIKLNTET